MHLSINQSVEDYEKQQEKINKEIEKNKSKGQILASLAKEVKLDNDPDVARHCKMARLVFEEGLDMYEDGDMTWDEFLDDLQKCLKAI